MFKTAAVLLACLIVVGCLRPRSESVTVVAASVETEGIAESEFDGLQPVHTISANGSIDSIESLVEVDSTDRVLFARLMSRAVDSSLDELSLGSIMQEVGKEFLGAEYVAGLLDEGDRERLVLSLTKFDCVLFVETVMAASMNIAAEDSSFDGFANRVRSLRYRDGNIDGYCSRLHYFSDWIADNERRGLVKNLTSTIRGSVRMEAPTFMSEHRELYSRFATNDSLFEGIKEMERDLKDVPLFYLPQEQIAGAYRHLKAGDIIATSTSVEGLDVSHTGLAYDNGDGTFGFMHASTSGGVKVSADLSQYVIGNRKQTGIVVVRPIDDRQN